MWFLEVDTVSFFMYYYCIKSKALVVRFIPHNGFMFYCIKIMKGEFMGIIGLLVVIILVIVILRLV